MGEVKTHKKVHMGVSHMLDHKTTDTTLATSPITARKFPMLPESTLL